MPSPRPVFDRLRSWSELFTRRPDLAFFDPLTGARTAPEAALALGAPRDLPDAYPTDMRELAGSADRFALSYRPLALEDEELRDELDFEEEDLLESCSGHLFLSLEDRPGGVHLEDPDGRALPEEQLRLLEADGLGTGHAAWVVLGPSPYIVWDVEQRQRFESLTDYLTIGARRAFGYGPCWQTSQGETVALASFSVPRTTPLPELRDRLIQSAASPAPEVADDLVAWLGADVCLLLAADS